ncbi:MAG: S8 family serine peptidase [Lachnospiraceae bacterium]|nr:S8 family serine peptidase [Lachnospiraceae bacterium]
MYNPKSRAWETEYQEEALLLWCREPFNRENPQAQFILADKMLSEASRGASTAEAVYKMEWAASKGYGQAALAMGQMFTYGWGVHRNEKLARQWYEKALSLGCQQAGEYLELLKIRKRRRIRLTAGLTALGLVVLLIGGLYIVRQLPGGIRVSADTELYIAPSLTELDDALTELVNERDTEQMRNGEESTCRLLVLYEGDSLDLSAFPALTVLSNGSGYVIIQFENEEDMNSCLEALKAMDEVRSVQEDAYSRQLPDTASFGAGMTSGTVTISADGGNVDFAGSFADTAAATSSYTGYSYMTWGAQAMGMDQLAAWLMTQDVEPVIVAVIDSGSMPYPDTEDRILEGYDFVDKDGGNGQNDENGHGTHVASTILDCTQGLPVYVLPLRALSGDGTGRGSAVVAALMLALELRVDVINMSLGAQFDRDENGECPNEVEDQLVWDLVEAGTIVVVSAGNDNTSVENYQYAHLEECIAVAACDSDLKRASFSNYGDTVDVIAPGVDVVSHHIESEYESLSGTSMAAPHVSALAAMLRLYLREESAAQIEKYIKQYCNELGNSIYYGNGIPWAGYFAGN